MLNVIGEQMAPQRPATVLAASRQWRRAVLNRRRPQGMALWKLTLAHAECLNSLS